MKGAFCCQHDQFAIRHGERGSTGFLFPHQLSGFGVEATKAAPIEIQVIIPVNAVEIAVDLDGGIDVISHVVIPPAQVPTVQIITYNLSDLSPLILKIGDIPGFHQRFYQR